MLSENNATCVVVKIGSRLINVRANTVSRRYLSKIVDQIDSLLADGRREVIVVSSGAIACGMSLLKLARRPKDTASLQAAAAIGQNKLMDLYRDLFADCGRLCAQLLLTWEDFEDRKRCLNVRRTLSTLLAGGIIPIINENDTVSCDEIGFGDNDKLSALVANLVGAEMLVMLSDVDGLYRWPKREVIPVVERVTPDLSRLCAPARAGVSVGGMAAKLQAIKDLAASGIPCVIANGRKKDIVLRAVRGEPVGTIFMARGAGMHAKKRWIGFGVRTRGAVIVDDGAKAALIGSTGSLLAVGIVGVRGSFARNDIVSVLDRDLHEFARGKVSFSSLELVRHLGARLKREVIDRRNLVIL
jgi:glutamate 5-kinase